MSERYSLVAASFDPTMKGVCDMSLNGLEGRAVAVRVNHKWYAGIVRWGGKAGLRVVTVDGRRIYRNAIRDVVCLP